MPGSYWAITTTGGELCCDDGDPVRTSDIATKEELPDWLIAHSLNNTNG